MSSLTIDTLRGLMRKALGEDDTVDLSGDILDAEMGELGFDSLAIIDVVQRLERDYKIAIPESLATEETTPRQLLEVVNTTVTEHA
ncbi:acyl carrier protein [Nocardia sp. NPDC046473]|uniref:acyl carrier protein n=1 Tax=Nocardia sp. NPDC046473 TaxID=3155733 RepID=UPI0033C5C36D